MNDLIMNAGTTMSSREIAELTGKRHKNVMQDIDTMLSKFQSPELRNGFKSTTYTNSRNRTYRMYKLDHEATQLMLDKYKGLARVPLRLQEESALKAIEQVLHVTLIRQYIVGGYRIDGYDATNNIAYEIDEPEHKYKHDRDATRQENIVKLLGCKFVRVVL